MRRKGLIRFILACLPWLILRCSLLRPDLLGSRAGLAIVASDVPAPASGEVGHPAGVLAPLLPGRLRAIFVLGDEITSAHTQLLAAALLPDLMADMVLWKECSSQYYIYLDYPESMRESPICGRPYGS